MKLKIFFLSFLLSSCAFIPDYKQSNTPNFSINFAATEKATSFAEKRTLKILVFDAKAYDSQRKCVDYKLVAGEISLDSKNIPSIIALPVNEASFILITHSHKGFFENRTNAVHISVYVKPVENQKYFLNYLRDEDSREITFESQLNNAAKSQAKLIGWDYC